MGHDAHLGFLLTTKMPLTRNIMFRLPSYHRMLSAKAAILAYC